MVQLLHEGLCLFVALAVTFNFHFLQVIVVQDVNLVNLLTFKLIFGLLESEARYCLTKQWGVFGEPLYTLNSFVVVLFHSYECRYKFVDLQSLVVLPLNLIIDPNLPQIHLYHDLVTRLEIQLEELLSRLLADDGLLVLVCSFFYYFDEIRILFLLHGFLILEIDCLLKELDLLFLSLLSDMLHYALMGLRLLLQNFIKWGNFVILKIILLFP